MGQFHLQGQELFVTEFVFKVLSFLLQNFTLMHPSAVQYSPQSWPLLEKKKWGQFIDRGTSRRKITEVTTAENWHIVTQKEPRTA